MNWLRETHGPRFELVRHFLARMFDSELSSTPGQWQAAAVAAFALLLPAGVLLLDPQYFAKYRILSAMPSPEPFRTAAVADELALLTLVTSLSGLLAMIQWPSLFPSRRDCLALASLPVRMRQIFTARFTAAILLSGTAVAAMNALPSFVAPLVWAGRWQKNPGYLANVWAHAVSSGLACLFVFLAVMALHGVLLNAFSARLFARLSVYVQGGLMAALFFTLLYSQSIADWGREAIAVLPRYGAWAPPVWFLGLHERMIGDGAPFFEAMSERALAGVAGAAALAALTYLLSYRRYRSLLLETPAESAIPSRRNWSVAQLLGREPRQQAVLHFIAKTLARSRLHRFVLLAYLGASIGLVLNNSMLAGIVTGWSAGWRGALKFVPLYWPLGISVVVLAGLRHVFSMPVELRANWVFQIAESQGRGEWMRALERFILASVIAPLYLVMTALGLAVVGWPVAARVAVLQILVSLTAFELLFHDWQKLPFTCAYVPGKRPLASVVAACLGVLGIVVPVLSMLIAVASRNTVAFFIFAAIFGATWLRTRKLRMETWGEGRLLYEDVLQVVPDLGLRS